MGEYDQSADMFSIGIILCQLLSGWHPFHDPKVDDVRSVRAKITAPTRVELPTSIFGTLSEEVRDLCRKLLEKHPKERLAAGESLKHAWFHDRSRSSLFQGSQFMSGSDIDGLHDYQACSKLKRAVLQLLTRDLSELQIERSRDKFMTLNSEGDGILSPHELAEGMRRAGLEMS